MSDFSFFLPFSKIEKNDDGSRLISGYASTPTKDLDGEIVALDAIKAALPAYWEWRNVREMHQPNAVGRAQEANVDGDGLFLTAKIVDEACVKKIDEKVLQGFSIGGRKLAKTGDTITELELIEISVVDRPANPDCRFTALGKAASSGVALVEVSRETQLEGDLTIAAADVGPLRKFFARLFGKGGDAPGEGDKPYGNTTYADSGYQKDRKKRYPIDSEKHIRAAWSYIGKPENQSPYTGAQLAKIKARIVSAWKAKIDKDGPPSAADKAAAVANLRKMIGNEVYDAGSAMEALRIVSMVLENEIAEDDNEDAQIADLEEVVARLKAFIASEIVEPGSVDNISGAAIPLEPGKAAKTASATTTDPAAVTGGTEAASPRPPFDELKEHLEMANLDEILARLSGAPKDNLAKRMNAGAMAKASHHLGEAMKCGKAAHGMFGKAAGCMMAHVKAQKGASESASDHLTAAMGHIAAGNAKMEEMGDHHDLAQHFLGKAAGAEGGPGENVGGSSTDHTQENLTGGNVPDYDPISPYPGKAAGMVPQAIVDQLLANAKALGEATAKAAAAEAKVAVLEKLPVGGPRAVRFGEVSKMFAPGSGIGEQPSAIDALYKGVNTNPGSPDQASDAAAKMIANMHANPAIFAKSVTDPTFRGSAGVSR